LIELLVVIAIIGLLATLAVVAFGSARTKARDARRQADANNIQKALEMYYAVNGTYPASGGATSPNGGWTNSNDGSWTAFKTAMAPYINLPTDPVNSGTGWPADGVAYSYAYYSLSYGCPQKWYMFVYRLENMTGAISPGITACDGTNFNYGGTMTVGSKNQ